MHSRMARSVPVVLLLSSLTALVGCNEAKKCDPSRDANCSTSSGRGGGGAFVSGGSDTSGSKSSPAGAPGESGSGTAARGGFGATAHGVGGGE
jgi:hypothetical protein